MHEETTKPIDTWDVERAKQMARSITERHGATPFAFQFITRERGDADLDSKETARSQRYYLGGKVETVEDVKRRADPSERILLANMVGNGWGRIITNTNSWRVTQPLEDGDVVLDWSNHQAHRCRRQKHSKIRRGEAVSLVDAIDALHYQSRLIARKRELRQRKWWFRVWRWITRNTGNQPAKLG